MLVRQFLSHVSFISLYLYDITLFDDVIFLTGKSSQDKIAELRKELKKKDVLGMVVNMLDEVAWLFNMRGSDVDYNPGTCPWKTCFFLSCACRCRYDVRE